jgi:hypothetical protein
MSNEWVSWFIDGKARHFSVESKAGRQILEHLGSLGSAVVCRAPKSESPNEVCGKVIAGHRDKKFCSKACQMRAIRSAQDARREAQCSPNQGGLHGKAQVPFSGTFHTLSPGVLQHASAGTVLPNE